MSLSIFARNLKHLRNKKKISRSAIVEYLKIKYSRYGPYEEARAFPPEEILVNICNALDYYDIYKMLTVDLRKDSSVGKTHIPADVSATLKEIRDKADGILNTSKN